MVSNNQIQQTTNTFCNSNNKTDLIGPEWSTTGSSHSEDDLACCSLCSWSSSSPSAISSSCSSLPSSSSSPSSTTNQHKFFDSGLDSLQSDSTNHHQLIIESAHSNNIQQIHHDPIVRSLVRQSSYSKHFRSIRRPHRKKKPLADIDEKQNASTRKYVAASGCMVEPSFVIRFLCYFSYLVLIVFAYGRMFLEWANWGNYNRIRDQQNRKNYSALYSSWQAFFTRYIYRRVADIFSIPITGNPGGTVTVLDRMSDDHNFTFHLTGNQTECINLASYDYLGFSQQSTNDPDIIRVIQKYGVGVNCIHELGMLDLHRQLEEMFAEFLGVESCMVFGMGFATNCTNIPTLADDQCLVLADERSHASAKCGIYLSGATFKYFKHNDCDDLEHKIQLAIWQGNEKRNNEPWKKIIIIVEGVYSMEGTIVDLPRLIHLKSKYKCYLYVDEAHSIGAVGPNGRGIVDYFNLNPNDVDLLMGTMTKSFAAAGGYIAGRKQVIDHIRQYSLSNYAGSISPPIIQQIINTLNILMDNNYESNHEGRRRIRQLLSNTHYMRDALKRSGFIVAGHYDSPVIPIMVYLPAKIGSIVRMAVRNGLALVCAGYPATSLTTNRIRLCMTAAHNRETLDRAIRILNMIGDVHHIKYQRYGVL